MLKVYIAATDAGYGYFDNVLWLENGSDKFLIEFTESTVARFETLMSDGTKLAKMLGIELELIYVS